MPEFKQYYIVKEHPVRIITKCKRHSKGTLLSFLVGICMIYAMLNWVPEILSIFFPASNVDLLSRMNDVDPVLLNRLPHTALVVYFYALFFSGVFRLGEALYTLTYIRNKRVDYRAIGEAFPLYGKTLAVLILQALIIAFWTMLFVIPGIIASINFSQSFYILADDPSKKPLEVLMESKMMMEGNRMNYVRLLLYYLPYLMISYVPSFLIADYALLSSLPQAAATIIVMICELPVFAAYGYMGMGRCVFYELMTNEGFAYFRYAGQDAFRELEKR